MLSYVGGGVVQWHTAYDVCVPSVGFKKFDIQDSLQRLWQYFCLSARLLL